ncbi:hypothetical protein F503_03066 [Ophiostoma piceae UAMH 11346]|uniref:Uncharacterized protein n=1 Tax=Ophiostoma piceae (strain UAMH 11346) TaxID=1262450 RepID=S3BZE5_OPHP1|nr:hypothetical protein F503_03066 [Ophiostoma piceae UAMH 11346]
MFQCSPSLHLLVLNLLSVHPPHCTPTAMMGLLDLPPELLLRIFTYVGAEYFREDISRLVVSKRWYSSAWETFASFLRLTAIPLARLAAEDQAPTEGGTGLDSAFTTYERVLSEIDIEVLGFEEERDGDRDGDGDDASKDEDTDDYAMLTGIISTPPVATEPSQLTMAFAQLAVVLKRCNSLSHMRLRTGPDMSSTWQPKAPILWTQPLADILAMEHLTSLDFDTAGALPMHAPGQPKAHLCEAISALLPNLHRLRCRMDDICASILDVPACYRIAETEGPSSIPGGQEAGKETRPEAEDGDDKNETNDTKQTEEINETSTIPRLRLKHLIINLSIAELTKTISSYRYPRTCNENAMWQFRRLQEAMETKATRLAKLLDKPEMVRIVSHTYPSLTTIAYDAITRRRYLLRGKDAWDAPGLLMRDPEGTGEQQSEEEEYDEQDMEEFEDLDDDDYDDDVSTSEESNPGDNGGEDSDYINV